MADGRDAHSGTAQEVQSPMIGEVRNKSTAGEKSRHLCELEVVKERDDVADDVEDGVGGGVGRRGGVAVAAEVGGQRAEPTGVERGHLVAPREPELREAVEEEHRRPILGATLGNVDGDAVDVRVPVPHLARVHALLLA